MSVELRHSAAAEFILIRHAEVDLAWKGICYGGLDVPLSKKGIADSIEFAEAIHDFVLQTAAAVSIAAPTLVFHSGLSRTAFLAEAILHHLRLDKVRTQSAIADERLRERNYGHWQGKSWDSVYRSDPEHFHDLVDRPDTYRPPEGETTTEMQRRVVAWYEGVLTQFPGCRIVAVSHSGPIAALAGHLLSLPANQWNPWIIGNLESIVVESSKVYRLSKDRVLVETDHRNGG